MAKKSASGAADHRSSRRQDQVGGRGRMRTTLSTRGGEGKQLRSADSVDVECAGVTMTSYAEYCYLPTPEEPACAASSRPRRGP